MTTGMRIRQIREQRNITIAGYASRVPCAPHDWWLAEQDQLHDTQLIDRITHTLGVTPEDLRRFDQS